MNNTFKGRKVEESPPIKDISVIVGSNYLQKFIIPKYETLFPYDWTLLEKNRCVICMNLLKFPRSKDIAYCDSKKHKRFVISLRKLLKK